MVDKELININRKVEDANYRYKMPKLTTVVQGSGGGMKTRLSNLVDVAEKYVLCPLCKLPEIIIQIKNKEVRSKCKACGKKCKLDNTHKFAKHIIKNPPSSEEDTKNIEEGGSSQIKNNDGSSSQTKSFDKSTKDKIS